MADSISGLKSYQINEIKKWRDMGYTQGQIAKKMSLRSSQISAAFKHLKTHPYN